MLLSACGNMFHNQVLLSLPEYDSEKFYTSGGFQDYKDDGKYYFSSITVERLNKSKYFSQVTPEDIPEIPQFLENNEEWVEISGEKMKPHYDFDKSIISEEDYFYIETENDNTAETNERKKFIIMIFTILMYPQIYSYYFHNNI